MQQKQNNIHCPNYVARQNSMTFLFLTKHSSCLHFLIWTLPRGAWSTCRGVCCVLVTGGALAGPGRRGRRIGAPGLGRVCAWRAVQGAVVRPLARGWPRCDSTTRGRPREVRVVIATAGESVREPVITPPHPKWECPAAKYMLYQTSLYKVPVLGMTLFLTHF